MVHKIDGTLGGLLQLHHRVEHQSLEPSDYAIVDVLIENLINREEGNLARMAAKAAAEAQAAIAQATEPSTPPIASPEPSADPNTQTAQAAQETLKARGHGRNGAVSFTNAKKIYCSLPPNTIGNLCPDCTHARLKPYRPKRIIHVIGQPLFMAEIYEGEQARCPGCGKILSANLPAESQEGIGKHVIYDWSACAMLLVLHYTGGMPFKRLELLHQSWGIPFSDANQWEVTSQAIEYLMPLVKALENHGIDQVQSFTIDDTSTMILELQKQITAELEVARALGLAKESLRTGINATCARMVTPDGTVILFFSGRHHAGEICDRILARRAPDAEKLIKVTDAASKNFSHDYGKKVIEAACNAHAFLKFRDVKNKFPEAYAVAGEAYKHIYENDDFARKQKMTPEERLKYHQQHSRPWMEKIKAWCADKLQAQLIEPRSDLWEPATFIINQWPRVTKFLETPGVPLDTNWVEQSLIIPVRYLAASFNYQTQNGAEVGDAAMSLIASARSADV